MDEWRRGWPVVAGAALAAATGINLLYYVFSIFIPPLQQETGWTLGQFSQLQALVGLGSLTAPAVGWAMDRHGVRPVYAMGMAMLTLLFLTIAILPFVPTLFGVMVFITGLIGVWTSSLAYTRAVAGWFHHNRGMALALAATAASAGKVAGGAAGGKVGLGKIQNFATGGKSMMFPRPANIPASDNVPAWLGIGEWVMRLSAVQKYGDQFMSLLNRGLLSKEVTDSLVAASRAPRSVSRSAKASYASGGAVGGQNRTVIPEAPRRGSGVVSTVVANEATMSRLAAGGPDALRQHARDHRHELRAILGV